MAPTSRARHARTITGPRAPRRQHLPRRRLRPGHRAVQRPRAPQQGVRRRRRRGRGARPGRCTASRRPTAYTRDPRYLETARPHRRLVRRPPAARPRARTGTSRCRQAPGGAARHLRRGDRRARAARAERARDRPGAKQVTSTPRAGCSRSLSAPRLPRRGHEHRGDPAARHAEPARRQLRHRAHRRRLLPHRGADPVRARRGGPERAGPALSATGARHRAAGPPGERGGPARDEHATPDRGCGPRGHSSRRDQGFLPSFVVSTSGPAVRSPASATDGRGVRRSPRRPASRAPEGRAAARW